MSLTLENLLKFRKSKLSQKPEIVWPLMLYREDPDLVC